MIEYFNFNLKYVKKIDIKHIKFSEYSQYLDNELKNNIDLNIITHNILKIYKNNKQIKTTKFDFERWNKFTHHNDKIFILNKKKPI